MSSLPLINAALEILDIRNLVLGIHDSAFPGLAQEDLGVGTPYSKGAANFLQFTRDLGFNGVQLGPQGITSPVNRSPYDGSLFSRNPLLLDLGQLTKHPLKLISAAQLTELTAQRPASGGRTDYAFAEIAMQKTVGEIGQRYFSDQHSTDPAYRDFCQKNADWLLRDGLYSLLSQEYGRKSWRDWGQGRLAEIDKRLFCPPAGREAEAQQRIKTLRKDHERILNNFFLVQFLISQQHHNLRQRCHRLGLKLYGDFQIGLSERDAWFAQPFLLQDYVMGAPPSRTNPAGQPWNYPVLDPAQYDQQEGDRNGPAGRFLRRRVECMLDDFDGLRIDHPHGLVCPWVYHSETANPQQAVQDGARLFASPTLLDHPLLAKYAIVRQAQINEGVPRHADNWVTTLEPEQVKRYAALFEIIMHSVTERYAGDRNIFCEILSTQPYPLQQVMRDYGQGRFRVTQKADMDNPQDVYRSENACHEDWLMLGNHDTAPIWSLTKQWLETGQSRRQAEYLAERLNIPVRTRSAWIEQVAADSGRLAQAKFADLFVGPGRNIMVYFSDLLGFQAPYNSPGTVSTDNWSQRIPPNYDHDYRTKLPQNLVLNIPAALASALRAQGPDFSAQHRELINKLESLTAK